MTAELEHLVGSGNVASGAAARPFLSDATEARGVAGRADAVVLPGSAEEVAAVMAWCYERDVPITPRRSSISIRTRWRSSGTRSPGRSHRGPGSW